MFEFINYGTEALQIFLLILLRASGIFLLAPIFGHKSVPALIRVGLVILLTGIVMSAVYQPAIAPIESLWQLGGLAIREILVGFVIGLAFQLLFMGIKTGGGMVGFQLGFAMVRLPDVDVGGQVSVVARFWVLLGTLIFLAVDGHHVIITALIDSYRAIPVGGVATSGAMGEQIIRFTAYVFTIAVKIAAPIAVTLFLVDVSLGTIAKMMPTMNVFFVGFPIKIGVGLVVVAMSLPLFAYLLKDFVGFIDGELRMMYSAWGEV